ncbi:MAG TPA: hypothetical protein VHW01_13120 [Polyangiaceae bacterium]|jgi:hypothetical protein|nr:hypothetical protein [Polyangiaceae bacterium]
MVAIALTAAERQFFISLNELSVPYLVVGLSAAVLQGADTATLDIDIWFKDRTDPRIADELGDRLDVVLTASGLESFEFEYQGARQIEVDEIVLPVLPLERIICSKRAAGRVKDLAVLPALEAALAAAQSGG